MNSTVQKTGLVAGITALFTIPIAYASYHLWVRSGQFLFHDHLTGLSIARSWMEGKGFFLSTAYYEPIPPLFLAVFLRFSDLQLAGTVLPYVFLHVLTTAAAYFLARRFLAPTPSTWVGFLVGFDPVLTAISGRMYAENSSVLLTTATLLVLAKTYPVVRIRHTCLLGVLFAICLLARVQSLAVTFGLLLALVLFPWRRLPIVRRCTLTALFLLSWGLALLPLAYWNHRTTGEARITPTRTMHTLCGGALATRYSAQELVVAAISRFSTGLVRRMLEADRPLLTQDAYCGERWGRLLAEANGNESVADRAMGKEVIGLIREAPLKYMLWIALSPIPFLAFEHEAINYLRPGLDRYLPVRVIDALSLGLWLYSISIVAFALIGTWILVKRRNPTGMILALVTWVYLAVHAPSTGQYRFAATVIPALIVLAVIGASGKLTVAEAGR
ncbi:MAG: glycosyltransferase family 39 protein [Nitrospirae bacterium]|nr:glycosyltransferase family 39 protein [Nitrospirota bacterium]